MTLIRSCNFLHALTAARVVLTHTEQERPNHNFYAQMSCKGLSVPRRAVHKYQPKMQ